jgi:hypothetical protein
LVYRPPPDAGRVLRRESCIGCGSAQAVELPELGIVAKYKLFCSVACAAGWAILRAIEDRIPEVRHETL